MFMCWSVIIIMFMCWSVSALSVSSLQMVESFDGTVLNNMEDIPQTGLWQRQKFYSSIYLGKSTSKRMSKLNLDPNI